MGFAKGPEGRTRKWEPYALTTAITFIGLYLGANIAGRIAQGVEMYDTWSAKLFAIQLLPFVVGIAALLLSVKFINKQSILSIFTFRKSFSFKRFFFAFSVFLVIQLIGLFVGILMGVDIHFRWDPDTFLPLLLVSITLLPIQTAFEDAFYRGYLFQGLTMATGKVWLSILIIAGLFGWMHMGNPEVAKLGQYIVIYYILSGLFMGVLAHLDDGLELGMGYHFANNFFGALIVTNTWQVFQTNALFIDHSPPYFGWENWLTLFIIQPGLLFLFYKVYRWKNPLKKIKE